MSAVFAKLFVNWSRVSESPDMRDGHTELGPCRLRLELGWAGIDQLGEIQNQHTHQADA